MAQQGYSRSVAPTGSVTVRERNRMRPAQVALLVVALAFVALMLVLPLVVVLVTAFREGAGAWLAAVADKYTLRALGLTLVATLFAVVINTALGLCAAWLVTALHLDIMFAVPGIILATVFVTFPFVSRSVIPVLEARGTDEEEAAALMGASGRTIFFRVTLPHVRWALTYGVVLCCARAMGEFGAVSVVSGHLRGLTNTLPLHIEILFNEFQYVPAFAVSTILVVLALVILVAKSVLTRRMEEE